MYDILNLHDANRQRSSCLTSRVSNARVYLGRANSVHSTVPIGVHCASCMAVILGVVMCIRIVILQNRAGLSCGGIAESPRKAHLESCKLSVRYCVCSLNPHKIDNDNNNHNNRIRIRLIHNLQFGGLTFHCFFY